MKNNVVRAIAPFLFLIFVVMAILTIARTGLSVWQHERLVHSSDWLHILLQGMRVDLSSLAHLIILPVLVHFCLPKEGAIRTSWTTFLKVLFVGIILLFSYMELVTPTFISEYDLRPNRLFVEYLMYPKEVFGMLWTGYKLSIFSVLLGTVGLVFMAWTWVCRIDFSFPTLSLFGRISIAAICCITLFLGARSTFGHRPLNPAMVAYSDDVLLNELTLNSTYSLAFALKNMASEQNAEKFYGSMDIETMLKTVKLASGRGNRFIEGDIPTRNIQQATYQGKKRNLVILLQESLGARFVGGLGGLPLTPNLDKLLNEGWTFEQLYATGTRSVRGIEAVTTGFVPTPSRAVVKLSKAQNGFFTIAQLLKQQGYHTQFVYGGESHFDNMKSFFLGNGFSDIVDLPKFSKTTFIGSWGACDQDLYAEAHNQFEQLSRQGKPFFSLVFNSSNHTPYEYPQGVIEQYDELPNTRNNAIKYSDKALGEFFEKAKQSAYWDDTVFLVIADHDARVDSLTPIPVKNFHIPGVILGADIEAKKDARITSSLDMPATMLSLIGVTNDSPMIGRDMSSQESEGKSRAMMQFGNNFGYLTEHKLTVLQPNKPAIGFVFDKHDLSLRADEVTNDEHQTALAHALLGNYLYSNKLYRLP
ncbi:LTA synthase family protein (plasmid) [Pseudoalteromonas xiamenensis]|uniref:LTA synthase family protein n=1 Tax=Pseudoalteromonas xiamenensis TaxID=882626 RepID=UPI0027E430CB|nr:LTA synthase family protein [Pseudoalteromonas xiamenensis]WMN61585.1 LTA synthase family protein [Pseudoalteromonas xiamenensis]